MARDWFDYITLFANIFTAIGTVGLGLLTVYFQFWRRPRHIKSNVRFKTFEGVSFLCVELQNLTNKAYRRLLVRIIIYYNYKESYNDKLPTSVIIIPYKEKNNEKGKMLSISAYGKHEIGFETRNFKTETNNDISIMFTEDNIKRIKRMSTKCSIRIIDFESTSQELLCSQKLSYFQKKQLYKMFFNANDPNQKIDWLPTKTLNIQI